MAEWVWWALVVLTWWLCGLSMVSALSKRSGQRLAWWQQALLAWVSLPLTVVAFVMIWCLELWFSLRGEV